MIEINIHKSLTNFELNIKVKVNNNQLIALYGTSGSGKTTTLRLLAGLLKPDTGTIISNGNTWFDSSTKTNIKTQERKIGYVFQDYALFPHLTVKQNLTFALQKNQDKTIVTELIDFMELNTFENRKPDTLSGGQKQRVALARALVQQPEILILDEPLSALDNAMRIKLQDYILRIHKKYKLTTILVSHDIAEIVKLSDYVFELQDGRIIKEGCPTDFFGQNKTSAKFRFTGEIIGISKEDIVYIASVLIGNDIVKVVLDKSEAIKLSIGDKVFVASKAFNPVIQRID